jgi:hypothetical protein
MRADPSPEPVFVDRTGTRQRWWTTFGVLSAAVLSLVAAGFLAALLGGGSGVLPRLPVPAPDGGRAAGSPAPSDPPSAAAAPSSWRVTPSPRVPAAPGPTATPTPAAPTPSPSTRTHGNPHPSKRP